MAKRYKVALAKTEWEQLTELTRSDNSTAANSIYTSALLLCGAGMHGDRRKVTDAASAL